MKNKIKFDLELYNSGEYDVVTREGKPVKIAGVNKEADKFHQVTGWVDNKVIRTWSLDGVTNDWNGITPIDLFLIPKKKIIKGWINIYTIYETKDEAIKNQSKEALGPIYMDIELIE